MSDLDIVLKLDPSAPVAGAKAVTAEVAKAEEQGKRTRAAFDSLSKGFASMAQGIRTQTAQALRHTGRAFDSLTEAIRREQVMLEKIHGPAKRYAEDLQVLDSLLARNKINTQQYAEQVANLNRQIEKGNQLERSVPRPKGVAPGAPGAPAGGQLSSIASGVGALNFKQAAAGVGQAFELVNSKLRITDGLIGSAIGSAVKFGATGAQIAGPWGAAIGAVTGLITDLVGKIDLGRESLDEYLAKQKEIAKAAEDAKRAAELRTRVEKELGPLLFQHADYVEQQARAERELAERMAISNRIMHERGDAIRVAAVAAAEYDAQLSALTYELSWASTTGTNLPVTGPRGPRSESDLEGQQTTAKRKARDAQMELDAATLSYGKTLKGLVDSETARADRLEDLAKIMTDFNVPQQIQKRALEEYNRLVKTASNVTKELAENQRYVFGGMAIMTAANGNIGTSERRQIGPSKALEETAQQRARDAEVQRAIREDQRRTRDYYKQIADEQNRLILNTKKWREEMESLNSISDTVLNQITSSASELTSHLVDAANGADVSWSDFGRNTLAVFQKLIMQALVLRALTGNVTGQKGAGVDGGYGGLFGLLGFASGGMIYPSGSGTSDSQTVMFRKAPSETVRIHTPSQEAAYRRGGPEGGGGGTTVRVVSEVDRRALYSANDLLVDIGRNRDTIRRLIA